MEDKKIEDKKIEEINPQILEMQQTMKELSSRLDQATVLISDKDKELEDMRAAKVKIVDDKLQKEKDLKAAFGVTDDKPKRSTDDINALTNVEMFEVIADVVDGSLNAHREEAKAEIDSSFKNLDTKFDQVVGHIMKKEADIALTTVRNDNKDFDKYHEDIREVLKKHQEFTYQDAYDWVKMQETKGVVSNKNTASEKPDKDLAAVDEDVVRDKKKPEGRKLSSNRNFRMKLEEAIDKVQARRGGQK